MFIGRGPPGTDPRVQHQVSDPAWFFPCAPGIGIPRREGGKEGKEAGRGAQGYLEGSFLPVYISCFLMAFWSPGAPAGAGGRL